MGAYRPNIYWHGKQNFPTPDRSSLPVNDLVAHYTRNLLPHTPWHTEFLMLLFAQIGVPAVVKVFIDKCHADISQEIIDGMRKQNNSSNAGSLVLSAIEECTTQLTEAALRTGLAMVLTQSLPSFSDCGEYRRRADHLCELLGLEAADLAILECCICAQLEGLFHNYCKEYYDSDWVALVAVAVNLQKQEVQKRLSKGGTLVSRGLIDMRKVSAPVFEYLMGISSEFLSSDDFSLGTSSAFPLDSFPVSEKERHLLVETLRNRAPCHLFFYGRPGTGKTELAKALAAESGKQAFLVKYRNDGDEKDRRGAIVATFGIAPADAVVIIDEADVLLNTATLVARKMVDKGWVNNFMDECRHKVIWIANNMEETAGLDDRQAEEG